MRATHTKAFPLLAQHLAQLTIFPHDFSMIFHASNLHKSVQSICDNRVRDRGGAEEVTGSGWTAEKCLHICNCLKVREGEGGACLLRHDLGAPATQRGRVIARWILRGAGLGAWSCLMLCRTQALI